MAWNDLEGIYVNIANGASTNVWPADFEEAPWVNVTLGGYGVFNSELLKPRAVKAGLSYDPEQTTDYYLNLAPGTFLDSSSDFMDEAFGSLYHIGAPGDPGEFVLGESGFIGFEFQEEAGGDIYYGWLRFTASNSSFGTVIDWAYNDTPGEGIEVGAVPEPSSAAIVLMATGYLVASRRRRRSARSDCSLRA